MIRTSTRRRLESHFGLESANVLTDAINEAYNQLVKAKDFAELKESVQELSEAQNRTEQRLDQLVTVVDQLGKAQTQTDRRVDRLVDVVGQLAQAQNKTEQRLDQLAQAQNKTEQRLDQLAQAQNKTEQRLDELSVEVSKLSKTVGNLAKQVGGLSDRVGGDLEEVAIGVVYMVLVNEFGWRVDALEERAYIQWNGKEEEIDPARPHAPIWIVGEAKFNLTIRELKKFSKQVERARRHLDGEVFPISFGYRVRPEVQEFAKQIGVTVVRSSGKFARNS